jgi:L-alanine-DL-glutamate epimerase-like enolase superfamily enzyme
MKIHIRDGDIHLTDVRTRMPFKYGIATMTEAPHAFVRLRVEVEGRPATGVSADSLPPKWFTKDPHRPLGDEVAEMLRVIEQAVRLAPGTRADSPFDAWRQLWDAQAAWGRGEGLPPLLTHFGTSLVERALLDAVCRHARQPFHRLLRDTALGIRLGDIHAPLRRYRSPKELHGALPLAEIVARHTVGLADPLTEGDIAPGERLDDGLPQSLQACVREYGLRHLKVKLSGDVGRDRDRLARVAAVLGSFAPPDFRFSVDGNEQFRSLAQLQEYWPALLDGEAMGKLFYWHGLFLEQPFHRDIALDPVRLGGLKGWPGRPTMIIDESDAELTSLPRALELGYAGTSHKNCKGVFKGVANACLLNHLRREQPARAFVSTGEDLANIGPVALLQDLAVCAALGIASVERNGHHYFAGLSMFPADVQRQVLQAHGDLYHPSRDGWPTLAVRDGAVETGSLLRTPFGVGFIMPVEQFLTPDAWRRANPV